MAPRLDVGGVLERVFAVYRQRWAILLPAALAIFIVIDLISALVVKGAIGIIGALALLVLSWIGTIWYQGLVVETVAESRVPGHELRIGDLFRAVQPRIGALALAGLLAGIAIAIGLVLIVVPGLILLTWWALIAPVVVLEGLSATGAFGRSRALVRGNGWRVFGVIVVVYLIQIVVTGVLQRLGAGSFVGYWLTSLVASVLTAPLGALAATIMYFDLSGGGMAGPGAGPGAGVGAPAGGWDAPQPGATATEPTLGAGGAQPYGGAQAGGYGEPQYQEQQYQQGQYEQGQAQPQQGQPLQHDPAGQGAQQAGAGQPQQQGAPTHPADWYPDPRGEKRLRYWDGQAWTNYTAD